MEKINVKIKKLDPEVVIPSYSKAGDAGMDITAISDPQIKNSPNEYCYIEYKTGISVEIPEGYVGLLFPRSSISKKSLSLANSVGVIDSGYRGEICFRFKYDPSSLNITTWSKESEQNAFYKKGERIGQLIIIPYPQVQFQVVEELNDTERGQGGFGSTGNN